MLNRLPAVGERASIEHTFTQKDISDFAQLSGDTNPVHLDTDAARRMGFDGPIVHGMLAAGLISRLLGTKLPGPGTIYLRQELQFKRPIPPGVRVMATVEVVSLRNDKPIIELATTVTIGADTAIAGSATVLLRNSVAEA